MSLPLVHPLQDSTLNPWFQNVVLEWAQQHGRHDFPWQSPHTAYKTWISEIMLQQTQAQRVVSFFLAFMQRFPTIESLADAQEDEVFHLWSGLGYYTRAQNIIKSARIVMTEHHGNIPTNLDQLILLPGIGRSTAGAIRSLGHGLEGNILDGNVRRVLGRFAMITGKPQSREMEEAYWGLVDKITPHKPVADRHFNQAMMDLGATICSIKSPKCEKCPLQLHCSAFKHKQQEQYPITASKYKKLNAVEVKAKRRESKYYLWIQHKKEVLLYKRNPNGIWRNLWCPLEFSSIKEMDHYILDLNLKHRYQVKPMATMEHKFSHFDLELRPYQLHIHSDENILQSQIHEAHRFLWYNMEQPQDLGLASPVLKLLRILNNNDLAQVTS